jgi:hypothetical protein
MVGLGIPVRLCRAAAIPSQRQPNLVRGESVHQLERVIHAGPIRVDRGRRRDEISGALTLLTNAVIPTSDEILAHIAPIAFRHINFQGIPLERDLGRLLSSVRCQKITAGAK